MASKKRTVTSTAGRDNINPQHYQTILRRSRTCPLPVEQIPFQAVDVIETFAPNNGHRAHALTYILRAGSKDDVRQDLLKGAWWLIREAEFLGADTKDLQKLLLHYLSEPK